MIRPDLSSSQLGFLNSTGFTRFDWVRSHGQRRAGSTGRISARDAAVVPTRRRSAGTPAAMSSSRMAVRWEAENTGPKPVVPKRARPSTPRASRRCQWGARRSTRQRRSGSIGHCVGLSPVAMELRMSLPKYRNSLADVVDIPTEISLLDQQGKAPARVCR